MFTLAALIALTVTVLELRTTISAWLEVIEGRASAGALSHLTGCRKPSDLHLRFGPPDADGFYRVDVIHIFLMQTPAAEAYSDPYIHGLILALVATAVFSQSTPLMIAAALFVLVWHGLGYGFMFRSFAHRERFD